MQRALRAGLIDAPEAGGGLLQAVVPVEQDGRGGIDGAGPGEAVVAHGEEEAAEIEVVPIGETVWRLC